jgi:hypothetical protein
LYDSMVQALFARMQSRDPLSGCVWNCDEYKPAASCARCYLRACRTPCCSPARDEYTGEVQRVTVVLRPISRALVVMVAVLNQPVAFMEPPPKL